MRWLLLPLLAIGLWAQPAARVERFPIEKITIQGLTTLPTEKVRHVLGLKVGQAASKADFEAARDRLVESGAFQSVGFEYGPSGKGYNVTYTVSEIGQLYPFRVEDLPVNTEQVMQYLDKNDPLFTGKIPGNQIVFDRYARRIAEYVATLGPKEEISAKLAPGVNNEIYLLFRPTRPGAHIAEVKFTGNPSIQGQLLQQAIAGTAIGTVFHDQDMLRYLDNSVRPVYEERGFVRVQFPHMHLSKAKDVEGVVVNVQVVEGGIYKLHDVKVQTPVSSARALLSEAKFKTDEVANFTEINSGIEQMKQSLRRQGYIRVAAETERKIDDDKKTVDLLVRFTPGPQYHFGKLIIEGLDILSEPVIRKMWGPDREGKPFDPSFPGYFLTRVKEDGVFDYLRDTTFNLQTHEDSHTVDVTLRFSTKENKPK